MKKSIKFILGVSLFAVISFYLIGCPNGSTTKIVPPEPVYSITLDRGDSYIMYAPVGGSLDEIVVKVSNTGDQPMTDLQVALITSPDAYGENDILDFDLSDEDLIDLAPGEDTTFSVYFQGGNTLNYLWKVNVRVRNTKDTKVLALSCGYYGVTDIDVNAGAAMIAVGDTGLTAATIEDKQGKPWFSGNPAVMTVDPLTGALKPVGDGEVFIGFIDTEDPFMAKGKVFTVYELIPNVPQLQSAVIGTDDTLKLKLTFDEPVALSNQNGFSISGSATATALSDVSGSGSETLTFTLNGRPAYGETVSVSYDKSQGNAGHNIVNDVKVESFTGTAITLDGFTEEAYSRPEVLSVIVNAEKTVSGTFSIEDAKKIYVTFKYPVQTSLAGAFALSGSVTADRITAINGSGTDTLIFTMNDWASWSENGDFKLSYNWLVGDLRNTNSIIMLSDEWEIDFQNYGNMNNVDLTPPKIVSALIENTSPSVMKVVFNKPVTLDAAKFQVKVHYNMNIDYATASVPSGGTMMDVGIETRTITGATAGVNNATWNLAMSVPAKHGEIIRLATTAVGAAKSVAANAELPVMPQFIVRSDVRRVKQAYEAEPGVYRNGVKDIKTGMSGEATEIISDSFGENPTGEMYNNFFRRKVFGNLVTTDTAGDPLAPQSGEIITIVLDTNQNVNIAAQAAGGQYSNSGIPWNGWNHAQGLRRNVEGAMIIFTTTTANINSANPKTVYINVDPIHRVRWAQNNITMVIDEHIVFRQAPETTTTPRDNWALVFAGDGGKIILDGGEISGSNTKMDTSSNPGNDAGSAVIIGGGNYGGVLLINRGKITGNTITVNSNHANHNAATALSTIAISQYGIVIMHGGEISGNTVNINDTPLAPRAGVISHFNNNAANHGKSSFFMTGGEIKKNKLIGATAYNVPSAGAVIVNGTFMKVGGTIYGSEANAELANTTNFNHNIKPGAVAVLANWNGTIANITLTQSFRRNNTSLPADVLVADCSKTTNSAAGTITIPTWIDSYWD